MEERGERLMVKSQTLLKATRDDKPLESHSCSCPEENCQFVTILFSPKDLNFSIAVIGRQVVRKWS